MDKVNILLVDDQPGKLLSYEALLAELEENLISAGSGREALQCLLKQDVALILLDVVMPEMDGFETARLIRQHPRLEQTPIIFVTALSTSEVDRLKGYALGAVDYVFVPVVPEILRAKVSVFVELYRKRQELSNLNRSLEQRVVERKRAEAALAEERSSLARRVEERTTELQIANVELARAARLKDEFLANMSHELRTPLNAILGISETMREQVYGLVNEKQHKALNNIEESGRHLLALINDVLDLSKIEAGKLELEIDLTPVAPVCEASLRLIKQAAHHKQLKIFSQLDPHVKVMQADERRLKEILVNLLSNAVKFTPAGGTIGLEVAGDAGSGVARFTVWDTGIGISAENQMKLFQPFVQVDSSLSRQYEGTGLGLVLVKRLVALHGGSIAVASTEGKGSRFTISLPWQEMDEASAPDEVAQDLEEPELPEASASETHLRRALIVEDSYIVANQISRYLHELGVETVIHPNAEGVIKKVVEVQPDFIILDILLPDPLGWKVLAELKAEALTKNIPVLIISIIDDQSRGLKSGAAGYLVKPISRPALQQALGKILPKWAELIKKRALIFIPQQRSEPPLILLADDNESTLEALNDYLVASGYRVVLARSGKEAIERAQEHHPKMIVLDIQMPGMHGFETIRHLRADGDLSATPIMALTALAMPGDRERCLDAGANDYLSKPVSLKELVRAIEKHLQKNKFAGAHKVSRSELT